MPAYSRVTRAPQFICCHMDAGYYNFRCRLSRNANVAKTTSGFNSDHTIGQYAHGLLLESQFLPSSTNCLAVRSKIRQKRPSRWP